MIASTTREAEVLAMMDQFMASYQGRDIEALMSIIASDGDLFLFGTGIDEKRVGPDEFRFQAERDWAQTEALAFNFTWHRVSGVGPVAWVASEGLGQGRVGDQVIEFPLRMTTVFEKQDGKWLLRQSHVSVPAAAQEEGDSVPV